MINTACHEKTVRQGIAGESHRSGRRRQPVLMTVCHAANLLVGD
jgi:hypothetical protein